MTVALIDYGSGNLRSAAKSLERAASEAGLSTRILVTSDPEAVRRGAANVAAQIENAKRFGVPVVVAINAFDRDSPEEHAALREVALAAGAADAVVCTGFRDGGAGAVDLAEAALAAVEAAPAPPAFLYPLEATTEDKLRAIATSMYRADDVALSAEAKRVAEFLDSTTLDFDRITLFRQLVLELSDLDFLGDHVGEVLLDLWNEVT